MSESAVPAVPTVLADHITEAQLARELGKTIKTLWRWKREGRGPRAVKIGKDVWYSRKAVAEWLESLENGGPKRRSRRAA